MTDTGRNVVVIAPQQIQGALAVVIQSAPQFHLLASATHFETILPLVAEKTPDVALVYLVKDQEFQESAKLGFSEINQLKSTWPVIKCITIVQYTSELEMARANGADIAFVDGVSAERLLKSLEGKLSE
jgi:DNA-binding NarL/FixJ family response regulator